MGARLEGAEAGVPEAVPRMEPYVTHVALPARDLVLTEDDPVAALQVVERTHRPAWCPEDIVDEWGAQSFPASDPPANW